MNKKFNQYVPFVGIGAIVIAVIIIFLCTKDLITEYSEAQGSTSSYELQVQQKEKEISEIDKAIEEEKLKLKSLKPVYETEVHSTTGNLSIYGQMFEQLVKMARGNGLMIRSIEYNMNPETDPLMAEHADIYNACELRFFFVGTYSQLQAFLSEINESFEYLTFVSKLSVTAFDKNTDYLLIKSAITIYSKKPESEISKRASSNRGDRRKDRR